MGIKKQSKTILTAILIGAALGISAGTLSAYMASSETATNTFTAGEVKIDLQEPAWKPENGKHLVAKQTVLKDPKIKNTGKNPAYVFMTVQVPVRTLTLYNDTGRKEEYSETTELFNLKKNVNGIYETLSDTNSGNWVLLKDRSTYGTKDESFTTYVYAYRVPVEPNAASDALFDAVQLKNVIEGYSEMSKISTKDEYPVTINGYAIQATDVIGADGSDVTDGTVTNDDLLRMYDTYVNQNGTGTGSSMNLMTDPSTQYKDGKMVIPELPKKTGYKNDGLWHDENGHTYAAGTEVTVTDEMKQNGFNLHVNWEPITYTVRFDSNGGSGTMEDLTMTYDEAATLPTNAFTKGTKFIGWSLSQTGSINFKDGAMIRNLSETDGDTVTLYALWKQNKFKVTYDANGGYYGTDTSKATNTVTYQKNQFFPKISKTDNVNKDGTDYSGGYGNNVNKTEVVTIPCAEKLKVTITYQTESTSYDWVCMWEGAHPEYTASNNYSSSKTGRLGFGKNTKEYTVTGDTVTFGFRSDESNCNYFGYYAVVEGEGISLAVKNGTFMQPSHPENLFVGWYKDKACTDGHEFSLEDCESNTTVYAKWKEPVAIIKDCSNSANFYNGLDKKLNNIAVNRAKITAFKQSNTMPDMATMTDTNIISTNDSDVPIYCWKEGTELKYWSKAKRIYAATDNYNLFYGYNNLSDISGLSTWNTSNVTKMSSMFAGCTSLADLTPLSEWDTENVTSMYGMFESCYMLTDLTPISMWNTKNVTSMQKILYDCRNLSDISPLSSWSTENVTDMDAAFCMCYNLANITPLSSWNTKNVTDMSAIFASCKKITDIAALQSWNTESVISMSGMFSGCSSLTNTNALSAWNTSNVTSMGSMFGNCYNLTDITALSNWDTGKLKSTGGMFRNCRKITSLVPLSSWDTGNLRNVYDNNAKGMFDGCYGLKSLDGLENWNIENLYNMSGMFGNCVGLTDITAISNWNTKNVTDMGGSAYYINGMFDGCRWLTDITPLSNWNTKSLKNVDKMFRGCDNLTDISAIADWNTTNLTSMSHMFSGCSSLTDLTPISSWNTENATNMGYMFNECSSLTDLTPISSWNTGKVTLMYDMFNSCSKLTNLTLLSLWNTENVENMRSMFDGCSSLTNLNGLANWNTENVTTMEKMFNGCRKLTDASGINDWDIQKVTDFERMFNGCPTHPTFTKRAGTWSGGTFTPAA